jgi:hypothetical protein
MFQTDKVIFGLWLKWWCITTFLSALALAYLKRNFILEVPSLVVIELWSVVLGIFQALLLRKYNLSHKWIAISIVAPILCIPIFIFLATYTTLYCCYTKPNEGLYTIALLGSALISGCIFAAIQYAGAFRCFSAKKQWIVMNGLAFMLLALTTSPESKKAWLFSAIWFGLIQATSLAWLLRSEMISRNRVMVRRP